MCEKISSPVENSHSSYPQSQDVVTDPKFSPLFPRLDSLLMCKISNQTGVIHVRLRGISLVWPSYVCHNRPRTTIIPSWGWHRLVCGRGWREVWDRGKVFGSCTEERWEETDDSVTVWDELGGRTSIGRREMGRAEAGDDDAIWGAQGPEVMAVAPGPGANNLPATEKAQL